MCTTPPTSRLSADVSASPLRRGVVVLPALAAAALAVDAVWDYPHQDLIAGLLAVVGTIVGWLLGVRLAQRDKADAADKQRLENIPIAGFLGANGVHPDTGMPNLQLTITELPDELLSANEVRLKIGNPPTSS